MSQKWKHPGDALQRTTGANEDSQIGSTSLSQTYGTCRGLQIRHLQQRFGIRGGKAKVVATLVFGERRR